LPESRHAPPTEHRTRVNGVELAWFEWGGHLRGRTDPVVFAHATGFHARVFDVVIERLGERHVVSLDQRGHGRSERAPIPDWGVFGEDLAAFVRALDLRRVVGVGHSMGGYAMVEAAARCPDRFARLLLIDPVIAEPAAYGEGSWIATDPDDAPHPTARRRDHFASPEEMFERFADRPPYAVFDRAALRDYCTWGLLPGPDGDGYALACPPAVEASIYATSRTNAHVHEYVGDVRVPVTVLRARVPPSDRDAMDFSSSPTWPGLADAFADGLDVHLPDHTHFVPMQDPELTARYVLARDGRVEPETSRRS